MSPARATALRRLLLGLLLLVGLGGTPVASAADGPAQGGSVAADAPQEMGTPLAEPPANAPPATEDEVDRLTDDVSAGLRCPVCQGMSVNDSPADGARSMKARIRELVAQGYTGQQIEDYFVDRYGVWVLLAPPATGRHWTVYVAPALFLLIGGGLIGLVMRKRDLPADSSATEPSQPVGDAEPDTPSDDPLEPYRQRILAELGADDAPSDAT